MSFLAEKYVELCDDEALRAPTRLSANACHGVNALLFSVDVLAGPAAREMFVQGGPVKMLRDMLYVNTSQYLLPFEVALELEAKRQDAETYLAGCLGMY
jgi:hypothetical protein